MERWSFSKMLDFLMCGERGRRRHFEDERYPSTLPGTRGSVVHEVAREANTRQYQRVRKGDVAGAPMGSAEARDMAADLFDGQLEFTLTREERADPSGARGREKDRAVALSAHYAVHVAPRLYPAVEPERKLVVQPAGADVVLVGKPDLITLEIDQQSLLTGGPRRIIEVVRDLKTGVKSPRSNQARLSGQLTFYGMLRLAETGALPPLYKLDHEIKGDSGAPAHTVTQETRRSAKDVEALVARLNTTIASVRAGVFMPANPQTDWWCSARWCEFWRTCKYVNANADEEE